MTHEELMKEMNRIIDYLFSDGKNNKNKEVQK